MQTYLLLISPLCKGAYFADSARVIAAETEAWLQAEQLNAESYSIDTIAGVSYLRLQLNAPLPPSVARLTFVQAVFQQQGELLQPLPLSPNWQLGAEFVYGAKYKGKTNELLTQLLINAALAQLPLPAEHIKLLDPMCGRGTTLLWAMRYGINSKGIEQDAKALLDLQQHLKKQTKLQRQKHSLQHGFVGKANKQGQGKFIDFAVKQTHMRLIIGDSRNSNTLLRHERFHALVSDLPYGIQHHGSDKARNPLSVLEACASAWANALKPGGVMALAYNRYMPKREAILQLFAEQQLEPIVFNAEHRMSESIVRDILLLKKPGTLS